MGYKYLQFTVRYCHCYTLSESHMPYNEYTQLIWFWDELSRQELFALWHYFHWIFLFVSPEDMYPSRKNYVIPFCHANSVAMTGTTTQVPYHLIVHDDVIKWKHFPRYWPFVRGIHRSSVNSPHKGQWRGALMFSLICALNKRLSKQSLGWWFETPARSSWRHCNVIRISGGSKRQSTDTRSSQVKLIGDIFNSSSLSAAYIRQWIVSALVQIMACRLCGAKPSSEPMLDYYQLDPLEQSPMKFKSKYKLFHSWKCIWKYRLWFSGHFVQGEMG